MNSKKELKFAYWLAIICFVVGVLSYTAFSAKAPDEPVRLMFKCTAGKVLFDHKTHTAESGYDIACADCHHHPEGTDKKTEGADKNQSCGTCHVVPEDGSFSKVCIDCHTHQHPEDEESELTCNACHVLPEDGQLPEACLECHEADEFDEDNETLLKWKKVDEWKKLKKSDGFHQQCAGCHKEQDAGPVKEECASCHVMAK